MRRTTRFAASASLLEIRRITLQGRETWRESCDFTRPAGPKSSQIEEIDVPPPGKGEVQIRIKALGLNRAESMFRSGQYLEEPKLPARLGYEAAGTVAAIGPGVQGFKVGDAVSTIPSFSLNALRALRRPRERPGPRRDPSSRFALVGRGGGGLDAVPDRLRGA